MFINSTYNESIVDIYQDFYSEMTDLVDEEAIILTEAEDEDKSNKSGFFDKVKNFIKKYWAKLKNWVIKVKNWVVNKLKKIKEWFIGEKSKNSANIDDSSSNTSGEANNGGGTFPVPKILFNKKIEGIVKEILSAYNKAISVYKSALKNNKNDKEISGRIYKDKLHKLMNPIFDKLKSDEYNGTIDLPKKKVLAAFDKLIDKANIDFKELSNLLTIFQKNIDAFDCVKGRIAINLHYNKECVSMSMSLVRETGKLLTALTNRIKSAYSAFATKFAASAKAYSQSKLSKEERYKIKAATRPRGYSTSSFNNK